MTGDALRNVAAWLDTYDALALSYFDLLAHLGLHTKENLASARHAVSLTEVQDDLRRWADELDPPAASPPPPPPHRAEIWSDGFCRATLIEADGQLHLCLSPATDPSHASDGDEDR